MQDISLIVHSLSEYFRFIEQNGLKGSISRGEAGKYPGIAASAFRPGAGQEAAYSTERLEKFFNAVCNELSPMQTRHFLAFAQHHGLPTNLVDFSSSPLVSLFFACYGDGKDPQGYVHFLEKQKLIAVDRQIAEEYTQNFCEKLFDRDVGGYRYAKMFLDSDVPGTPEARDYLDFLTTVSALLAQHFGGGEAFAPLQGLSAASLNNNQLSVLALECFLEFLKTFHWEYLDMPEHEFDFYYDQVRDDIVKIGCILKHRDEVFGSEATRPHYILPVNSNHVIDFEVEYPVKYYVMESYFTFLTWYRRYTVDRGGEKTAKEFFLPFYFSYSPPNIAGRINMQNSIFLVQMHLNQYGGYPLYTQRIRPDVTIQVADRKAMLQQLDMVGINLKTIYGDYDNIARYIKENP